MVTCPHLPSMSVDFDALHAVALAGGDLQKHVGDLVANPKPKAESVAASPLITKPSARKSVDSEPADKD